jgi:hypothetical protein
MIAARRVLHSAEGVKDDEDEGKESVSGLNPVAAVEISRRECYRPGGRRQTCMRRLETKGDDRIESHVTTIHASTAQGRRRPSTG